MRLRDLGLAPYEETIASMREFTKGRDENSEDELWLLQHPPVFTQGIAGKPEHLLRETSIPTVQTDRGGQVTYHGPGQLVIYTLINIKRAGLGVRGLVTALEQSIVATLSQWDIDSAPEPKAPGVYVSGAKIASLGLKISRGCSYHGLSINVNPDLTPFRDINPCGYAGLEVTSMQNLLQQRCPPIEEVGQVLVRELKAHIPAK